MSKWKAEVRLVGRFLGGGAANTLLGFAAIFALIAMGVAPLWANVVGYGVGVTLGFLLSRNFVFHGKGNIKAEGVRYFFAFGACFLLNIFVLYFGMRFMAAVPAQLLASMAYTFGMFLLSRLWVYRR